MSSEHYLDDIYAFFQNCYHLKDWLKNDVTFTAYSHAEIESYVSATPALAVCADLCNGIKHLVLSNPPRSGDTPRLGQKTMRVHLQDSLSGEEFPTKIQISVEVEHGGHTLDAFQLATDAMQAWECFLS